MTVNILTLLSVMGTISAIVFSIISAFRANKKDAKEEATAIAVLNSDLGYVKSGIDRIEQTQRTSDTLLHDLTAKVSNAENSAKSAHHRLDMHEARIVKLEHEQDS